MAAPYVRCPVGLVGLGLLGQALARRLMSCRYEVAGFDVDAEKNAAFQKAGGQACASAAEVDEMVDTNVKGLIFTAQATIPHLRERGGDFVTLASEAGRRGLPDEAVYVASKFAQVGFTRSLDHELRRHGIRCSNICPGGVATNFGMGRGLRTPGMPQLADMMRPEDVAEVVIFTLTRPPSFRVLETAFRSMHEASWG